jgi:hypothetical protein
MWLGPAPAGQGAVPAKDGLGGDKEAPTAHGRTSLAKVMMTARPDQVKRWRTT